jgi:hypothetical protein
MGRSFPKQSILAALTEAEVAVIVDGDDVTENVEGHNVPLVLLVNPDDYTRDLYGNWLVSLGFDLMCAADAQVALGPRERVSQMSSSRNCSYGAATVWN